MVSLKVYVLPKDNLFRRGKLIYNDFRFYVNECGVEESYHTFALNLFGFAKSLVCYYLLCNS